ncbi:MAG: hypothetical protein K8R69_12400 [Deltaproteobacteria bacterium]|nr:hypothetical protein [Deltaproteobacteria bacterium]
MQTSTQMMVAKSDSGILGSQPDVYNMDNDMVVPELPLLFNDGNEDTLNWIYNKDDGQENFPSTATVHEGVFNQDHPLCAPDPKGCEGRFLRWFDLGPLPEAFTDIRTYIAKLHKGKLKRIYINSKVSYVDVAIGAGNQVKIPTLPAKGGHIYCLLLVPEGEPIAIANIEMNLDDLTAYAQFEKMTMSPDWHFARGILVKEPKSSVLQYRPESTLLQVIPQSGTKIKAGGGQ